MTPNSNSRLDGLEVNGWDRVIGAGLILLAFLLGVSELFNTDIWWHLKTGQLIWQRGQVTETDWYTYTNPDSKWIDLHWGFQLIVAGLWAIGGSHALILAKSVLGAGTFVAAASAGLRQWPFRHTMCCLLPALLLYAGRYVCRPDVVSGFLLAVTLTILFHARHRPRLAWFLVPVQLIWINVQGLFILGWVVWCCFLVDAAIRRWLTGGIPESERTKQQWRLWSLVSLAMLLANLANPYTWRGVLFPLTLFRRINSGGDRQFLPASGWRVFWSGRFYPRERSRSDVGQPVDVPDPRSRKRVADQVSCCCCLYAATSAFFVCC